MSNNPNYNKIVLQPHHEPDYIIYTNSTFPDDPFFADLWGMDNANDVDIDAPEAWDIGTGTDVVIGVIDSGVDYNHPDLRYNIRINPDEDINGDGEVTIDDMDGIDNDENGYIDDIRGWDFVNNDNDPMDDNFHGTHCAGIIAAKGDNLIGVTGVNWNARIIPIKINDFSGGGYTSDAIKAIYYAISVNAQLTNNSWGGTGYSLALEEAIEEAGEAGQLFITSAGNHNHRNIDTDPVYPASYDCENIITVASINSNDLIADSSNVGIQNVDLGAPGVAVYSTTPTNETNAMQLEMVSTDYDFLSGTSMAGPHVTGVAALIWSIAPGLPWQDVKRVILDSVVPTPALNGQVLTGGRLNAFNAMATVPAISVINFNTHDNISGNYDEVINPGEMISIDIDLKNTKLDERTQISATLTESDANILIFDYSESFGDIPPGGLVQRTNAFQFAIASGIPTPYYFTFTLTITTGEGDTIIRELPVGIFTSGYIQGNVTLDGQALEGASIKYKGPLSGIVDTDSNGNYSITTGEGSYKIKAIKGGYIPTDTVDLSLSAGSSENVNFSFTTATISGTVYNAVTGQTIEDADIDYTGTIEGTVTSDSQGYYSIENVYGKEVSVDVKVKKDGMSNSIITNTLPPDADNTHKLYESAYKLTEKITPASLVGDDYFGSSVAMSGDTAIAGAWKTDNGNGPASGAVFVYEKSSTGWSEAQKLTAGDADEIDFFGWSCAIHGNTAVISASGDDQLADNAGAIYVFENSGSSWQETTKLIGLGGGDPIGDEFGHSVDITENYIIAGAPGNGLFASGCGLAYIFEYVNSVWQQTTILYASDPGENNRFGQSVAISGNYAVVGSPQHSANAESEGAVYIFEYNGSTWNETAKIMNPDSVEHMYFGNSVDIEGERIAVGAFRDPEVDYNAGSVYIIEKIGSQWEITSKLTASDPQAKDEFGIDVSLSGDNVLIGSWKDDENNINTGSAYVFTYIDSTWIEVDKIYDDNSGFMDGTGAYVAMDGKDILLGNEFAEDLPPISQGAVHFYELDEQEIKINFQPPSLPAPFRYMIDGGLPYTTHANGYTYGWSSDHTALIQKRSLSDFDGIDAFCQIKNQGVWEIELADGTYDVEVGIGDPIFSSTYTINIEDVNYWNNEYLGSDEFLYMKKRIGIADGRLTLDNGNSGYAETGISFIKIKPVTITPGNLQPTVDAGSDVVITLPVDSVTLEGIAQDDGIPNPPGTVTTTWSVISSPEESFVSFNDPNDLHTQVIFSIDGTYMLRLAVDDGELISSDTIVITVEPETTGNGAFVQDSGTDGIVSMEAESYTTNTSQSGISWTDVTTPTGYSDIMALKALPNESVAYNTGYTTLSPRLDYEVNFTKTGTHYVWIRGYQNSGSDDSIHAGLDGAAISSCDRISDFTAGTYSWSSDTMDSSRATFQVSSTGLHTFNLWMREDGFIVDKIVITSNANYSPSGTGPVESPREGGTPPANQPPSVDAGPDDSITLPVNVVTLAGNITDDGLPLPPGAVTAAWSVDSTPSGGSVTFGNANALNTQATFSIEGTYILRLTGDDGELTTSDTLQVVVNPAQIGPIYEEHQAEDASWNNGDVESEHSGYTGTGYVNTGNAAGNYIEWNIYIPGNATGNLSFRYANGSQTNRHVTVTRNSTVIASQLDFATTNSWTTWSDSGLSAVQLISGYNTIRITANTSEGAANIDRMDIEYTLE